MLDTQIYLCFAYVGECKHVLFYLTVTTSNYEIVGNKDESQPTLSFISSLKGDGTRMYIDNHCGSSKIIIIIKVQSRQLCEDYLTATIYVESNVFFEFV